MKKLLNNSLGGFDGGRCGHDHEYAVNQNCCDDEQREEWVDQYVDGHPSYWIKWIEDPHRVGRGEPEYVLSFTDDHERLEFKCFFNYLPSFL